MDAEESPPRLAAALLTIPVVWAALILAGLAGLRLQPSMAGAGLSLLVYLILLFGWGQWTERGRRTYLAVYLLAAFLYWLACVALFIAMPAAMMTGWLDWFGAGMVVGFQPYPNPHTPVETYLIPMVINMFAPIIIMGALRPWLDRNRPG
ncbi:MAG TPA: hypothetical protein VEC11_15325 [Allosphingosinicella sp.]|nr:hypothetical protein [Allosphingosinicella sp.]